MALDVTDAGLPQCGQHGGALDEGDNAQALLLVQFGQQRPERFLVFLAAEVLGIGTVDLDVLCGQMLQRVERVERTAEIGDGQLAAELGQPWLSALAVLR